MSKKKDGWELELTREQKDKLRELAEKATPGPWEYNDAFVLVRLPDEDELRSIARPRQGNNVINVNRAFGPEMCKANAAYLAAANPQTILALLDEMERLEKLVELWQRDYERLEASHLEKSENYGDTIESLHKEADWLADHVATLCGTLHWTRAWPKKPGYYFRKRRHIQVVKIDRLELIHMHWKTWTVAFMDDFPYELDRMKDALWAGPISLPEDWK